MLQCATGDRFDGLVWQDRQWEWPSRSHSSVEFHKHTLENYAALEDGIEEALASAPALFRRSSDFHSFSWICRRAIDGSDLDGDRIYRLSIPPVALSQFSWSVTVFDARTHAEIHIDGSHEAARMCRELREQLSETPVDIFFGSEVRDDAQQWIRTERGRNWLACLRISFPKHARFDRSWRLGDFEPHDDNFVRRLK